MFSVTQYGVELDKSKYNWDEKNKIFTTKENDLTLDFKDIPGVTFYTGSNCTFNTDSNCKFITGSCCRFNTGWSCTFTTHDSCTFTTSSNCVFYTRHSCVFFTYFSCEFNTGDSCVFKTGHLCTFNTGSYCTFRTGFDCTFKAGENCFVTRYDVRGVIEIPINKTIKLNEYEIAGYTEVKEIKETNCDGKVVVIDGKEYVLQLKS